MSSTRTRPLVSVNMAVSADGKITTHRRERFALGSAEDRLLMDVLRARSDAVIIGATSLRLDGWAIRVRDPKIRRRRLSKGLSPHPLNVVLSTALDVPTRRQFFTHQQTERLVVTTRAATESRLRRVRRHAEVVVVPTRRVRARAVLDLLAARGAKHVLLEGGGTLNYTFFAENLVDEVYITITPRILGGATAPTAVDGPGFLQATQKRLDLVSSRRRGDEVFLKYRVRSQ